MNTALFIAWRTGENANGSWSPVAKLERSGDAFRFLYTRGAKTLAGFEPFPGFPKLDAVYESNALFPMFTNRLLSKSRPEYEAYLTWAGFDPNNPPDPLVLLGVTEGQRQTDALEVFPCPVPDAYGCYLTKFFVHGIRWFGKVAVERIRRLEQGEPLAMMPDCMNVHDPHAVAVRTAGDADRLLLGYVPRYLARDILTVCLQCDPRLIELNVERVNDAAPLQMRLLCRISACWPEGFRPCSGEAFQPLAEHSAPNRSFLPRVFGASHQP